MIDSNSYMALETTDEVGHPWVSPVWFASEDYLNFHWVSSPDAKHSRNLAAHPDVACTLLMWSRGGRCQIALRAAIADFAKY